MVLAGVEVSSSCQGLSVSQRVAVKNALLKLKLQLQLHHIDFWGKINGTSSDYLIAEVNNRVQLASLIVAL